MVRPTSQIEIAVSGGPVDRNQVGHGHERKKDQRVGKEEATVVPGSNRTGDHHRGQQHERQGQWQMTDGCQPVVSAEVDREQDELGVECEDSRFDQHRL